MSRWNTPDNPYFPDSQAETAQEARDRRLGRPMTIKQADAAQAAREAEQARIQAWQPKDHRGWAAVLRAVTGADVAVVDDYHGYGPTVVATSPTGWDLLIEEAFGWWLAKIRRWDAETCEFGPSETIKEGDSLLRVIDQWGPADEAPVRALESEGAWDPADAHWHAESGEWTRAPLPED